MAIILIDCQDCYDRAERIFQMGQRCRAYSGQLESDPASRELSRVLDTLGHDLTILGGDIKRETDAWSDYYATNHPHSLIGD